MTHDWTQDFFSGLWLDAQRQTWSDEESDANAEACAELLDLPDGAEILDVPCGDGRVALRLAANGYRVTGFDRSPELLDTARESASTLKIPSRWDQGDMRALPYSAEFDGAICIWGSLGYGTEAEDGAFLAGVARSLRPGGGFILDTHVAETLLPNFHDSGFYRAGDVTISEHRSFDPLTSRIDCEWVFTRKGKVEERTSSIRIYSTRELTNLLQVNNFSDFDYFGSMQLEDFETGSPRLVLRARRVS